jgi:hypothetical protein
MLIWFAAFARDQFFTLLMTAPALFRAQPSACKSLLFSLDHSKQQGRQIRVRFCVAGHR